MIKRVARELTRMRMELNMSASGKTTSRTVTESRSGLMDKSTRASTKTAPKLGREY